QTPHVGRPVRIGFVLGRGPRTLREGRIDGILPVVGVSIATAAKIKPGLRVLMREQRTTLNKGAPFDLQARRTAPRIPGRSRQGTLRSADAEQIHAHELAIAAPAMRNETVFRTPAMRQGLTAVQSPLPIDATVDAVNQRRGFGIVHVLA